MTSPIDSSAPAPWPTALPERGEPAGITLARLSVLIVLAITAGRIAGLPAPQGWAALTAVTLWSTTLASTGWTALAAAAETWLLGTGFLVDRLGVLEFGPADRLRFAVLVAAAGAGLLIGRRTARVASTSRVPSTGSAPSTGPGSYLITEPGMGHRFQA